MCKGTYIHLFKSHRTRKGLNRSSDQPSIYPPQQGSFESNVFLSSTPHTSYFRKLNWERCYVLTKRCYTPFAAVWPKQHHSFQDWYGRYWEGSEKKLNLYKVQYTTQAMVRSLSSLLLVKKNKSKALSWMEPDLSLLSLFVLFSIFCFLLSNSKGSVFADPNKCFYFKTFILLLQESSLLPLEQERETSP